MTSIENKCAILSDLYTDYQDDIDFCDFILENEEAFEIAKSVDAGVVGRIAGLDEIISELFNKLLATYSVIDSGFDNLDDFMTAISEI